MFTRQAWASPAQVGAWGKEKVVALLVAGALAVLLVVVGLGLALYYAFDPPPVAGAAAGRVPSQGSAAAHGSPGDVQRARRDDLAAAPMAAASALDAQPSVLSTRDPGFIVLPAASTAGPVGVPTGFDHTAAGALAQLAGIDTAALDSASVGGARAVIESWAAPGGPTAATWSGVTAMADFLSAAGLSAGKAPDLALSATPLMGLVKATDGGSDPNRPGGCRRLPAHGLAGGPLDDRARRRARPGAVDLARHRRGDRRRLYGAPRCLAWRWAARH
jgi:hypothetical protein